MNDKVKTKNGFYVYLPKDIINKVNDLKTTRINREKMFKFLENLKVQSRRIGGKSDNEGEPDYLCNFVPLPKNYLLKVLKKDYHSLVIQPLEDAEIIEINHSYSNHKGKEKCKEYRISPNFLEKFEPTMDSIDRVFVEGDEFVEEKHYLEYYINCSQDKLVDELYFFMDGYLKELDNISPNEYILTTKEQVGVDYIPLIDKKGEYFKLKTEEALKRRGYIIKDKHKFFIKDGAIFLKNKIVSMKMHAIECVLKLINSDYYAKRNQTNTRLDTNFTNMPSKIFDKYKEINNLTEFDIKNNQFAILAHILPNKICVHEDVKLFKFLAEKGELYEYIEDSLNLRSRKDAKILMITTMFASQRVIDRRIKNLFPNLVKWIKEWKKEFGDNGEFAIMLQKKEAEIFIDGLMHRYKDRGYCVITKHDSLIVDNDLAENIKSDMEEYFKMIGFKCTIN